METEASGWFIDIPFGQRGEKRISPSYRWENAGRGSEAYVIFQWGKSGTGNFRLGEKIHEVKAGEAFIAIVPEDSCYYYPPHGKEPWEFSWINFYGDMAVRLWGELRKKFGPVIPIAPDSPAALELSGLLEKARKRQWGDRFASSAAGYQFYLTLWSQLISPRGLRRQGIEEAAAYLRAHYRDRLRVKEAADYVGMSREHFTRLFYRQYRKSPAAYLREERLKVAARLLETTMLPIGEVAFRTGFYSHAQFGQLFRRRYKKTPLRYRLIKMK